MDIIWIIDCDNVHVDSTHSDFVAAEECMHGGIFASWSSTVSFNDATEVFKFDIDSNSNFQTNKSREFNQAQENSMTHCIKITF